MTALALERNSHNSFVGALAASTRAELLRLRRWPAMWVMIGVWFSLTITFTYVFPYIAYATGNPTMTDENIPAEALLADMLPSAVPEVLTQGMPLFGGAIMLIMGALAAGSGYNWGTWKTALTQGPSRITAFAGTFVALAGVVVGVVTATFLLNVGASTLIATVESQTIHWPALEDTAQSIGGGVLIFGMWASAGVLIGTLTRSPALATGLGLVWTLVVENLLRGVSGMIDGLHYITDVLPGTTAGSMAGALGATAAGSSESDGAPGVTDVLSGGQATLILAVYIAVFVGSSVALMRRRDLA